MGALRRAAVAARRMDVAEGNDRKRAKLGNLGIVWRAAGKYPAQIGAALFFLILSSAATLAIPYGF